MILGASFDPVDKNRAFAEKFGFPFKLLCDIEKQLKPYGCEDPSDPEAAKRISYLIGPDRKVVKAYANVKPKTHPEEVLTDLTNVQR